MGGRGSSFYGSRSSKPRMGSADGTFPSPDRTTVSTYYRRARGMYSSAYWGNEVLETTTDGNGNLTFDYAQGGNWQPTAKTNRTVNVDFDLLAGAVDGQTFNVDWDKVQSISGKTYSLRTAAKAAGLKWDSKNKIWKRP